MSLPELVMEDLYCEVHGEYYDEDSLCPGCYDEEKRFSIRD